MSNIPDVVIRFLDVFIQDFIPCSNQTLEEALWHYCWEWDLGYNKDIVNYVKSKCDPNHIFD